MLVALCKDGSSLALLHADLKGKVPMCCSNMHLPRSGDYMGGAVVIRTSPIVRTRRGTSTTDKQSDEKHHDCHDEANAFVAHLGWAHNGHSRTEHNKSNPGRSVLKLWGGHEQGSVVDGSFVFFVEPSLQSTQNSGTSTLGR